jgi:hypothetical protein
MGKLIIECVTWGLAALFFGVLMIMAFGLTPEDVRAIFNYLGSV